MTTTTRTKRAQKRQHRLTSILSSLLSALLPARLPSLAFLRSAWKGKRLSKALERVCDEMLAPWIRFRLGHTYPPMKSGESVGTFGERLACEYLARKRYFVLERSFRASGGEIDIIAAFKNRLVVFVEVKTWVRPSVNNGGPSDRIDERKKRNITNTSLRYLKQHHILSTRVRIDVIEVILEPAEGAGPSFRHFENAFEPTGRFQMFS